MKFKCIIVEFVANRGYLEQCQFRAIRLSEILTENTNYTCAHITDCNLSTASVKFYNITTPRKLDHTLNKPDIWNFNNNVDCIQQNNNMTYKTYNFTVG